MAHKARDIKAHKIQQDKARVRGRADSRCRVIPPAVSAPPVMVRAIINRDLDKDRLSPRAILIHQVTDREDLQTRLMLCKHQVRDRKDRQVKVIREIAARETDHRDRRAKAIRETADIRVIDHRGRRAKVIRETADIRETDRKDRRAKVTRETADIRETDRRDTRACLL